MKIILDIARTFGFAKAAAYIFAAIAALIALALFVQVAIRGVATDAIFDFGYIGLGCVLVSFGFYIFGKTGLFPSGK